VFDFLTNFWLQQIYLRRFWRFTESLTSVMAVWAPSNPNPIRTYSWSKFLTGHLGQVKFTCLSARNFHRLRAWALSRPSKDASLSVVWFEMVNSGGFHTNFSRNQRKTTFCAVFWTPGSDVTKIAKFLWDRRSGSKRTPNCSRGPWQSNDTTWGWLSRSWLEENSTGRDEKRKTPNFTTFLTSC
jgi:hypothetical protein